jgi:transposase
MTNTQKEIIERTTAALKEQDRLRKLVRENDMELRALCRAYDRNFGVWGSAPHHLRQVVENYGLLDKAV